MPDKKVALNITSAVAIGGKIIVPGSAEAQGVLVDEALAKNLLQRGRAELSTAEERDVPSEEELDAALAGMSDADIRAAAKEDGIKEHASAAIDDLKAALKAAYLG